MYRSADAQPLNELLRDASNAIPSEVGRPWGVARAVTVDRNGGYALAFLSGRAPFFQTGAAPGAPSVPQGSILVKVDTLGGVTAGRRLTGCDVRSIRQTLAPLSYFVVVGNCLANDHGGRLPTVMLFDSDLNMLGSVILMLNGMGTPTQPPLDQHRGEEADVEVVPGMENRILVGGTLSSSANERLSTVSSYFAAFDIDPAASSLMLLWATRVWTMASTHTGVVAIAPHKNDQGVFDGGVIGVGTYNPLAGSHATRSEPLFISLSATGVVEHLYHYTLEVLSFGPQPIGWSWFTDVIRDPFDLGAVRTAGTALDLFTHCIDVSEPPLCAPPFARVESSMLSARIDELGILTTSMFWRVPGHFNWHTAGTSIAGGVADEQASWHLGGHFSTPPHADSDRSGLLFRSNPAILFGDGNQPGADGILSLDFDPTSLDAVGPGPVALHGALRNDLHDAPVRLVRSRLSGTATGCGEANLELQWDFTEHQEPHAETPWQEGIEWNFRQPGFALPEVLTQQCPQWPCVGMGCPPPALPVCGDLVCDPGECVACAVDCPIGCEDCRHDVCFVGDALNPSCDPVMVPTVATVCAADPYCCAIQWDATCVYETGLCVPK